MVAQTKPRIARSDTAAREAVRAVVLAGVMAASRGWVPATSGNFSARIDERLIAITATGTDKGALRDEDVPIVPIDGERHPRVSAEAPLHYALYRAMPDARMVMHVHSMNATLASLRLAGDGRVAIEGLELLKAFRGIRTHETRIEIPVFANTQDVDALASTMIAETVGRPGVHGFLLEGHGLYAWGRDPAEAWRHLEAFDHLFALRLELRRLSP
jgi:methylthioribulose-1-phosphate dehydratase